MSGYSCLVNLWWTNLCWQLIDIRQKQYPFDDRIVCNCSENVFARFVLSLMHRTEAHFYPTCCFETV